MKNTITRLLFLLLLPFIASNCSLDDSVLKQSIIEGHVKNKSGETLAGTTVELVTANQNLTTQTDAYGYYRFEKIPYGMALLKFSNGEYDKYERGLTLEEPKKTIDITLHRFLDEYYLQLSSLYINMLNITTEAGFTVSTNAGFKISCKASWLNITPQEGSGNQEIKISCTPNNEPVLREAEIIVSGDFGLEERVTVIQQPGPILSVESVENPEYLPHANREGVFFHFTRPVSFGNVVCLNNKQTKQVQYEILNGGLTVKLQGFSQSLFDVNTYILTVEASDGIKIETEFNLRSFLKKVSGPYISECLFIPSDERYWALGYDTYSLHKVKDDSFITPLPDSHAYSHIVHTPERIIGFRKKHNRKFYADFYQLNTGKHLEEKQIILDPELTLAAVSILNNGIALLHCENKLYLLDTNQPQLSPYEVDVESIEAPDLWSKLPKFVMSAGTGNSFYLYHNDYSTSYNYLKTLYEVNASTKRIRKIELPADGWTFSASLHTPDLIFSFNDKLIIMNTAEQNETVIHTSHQYRKIVPVKKENKLTHLLTADDNGRLRVIDIATKSIYNIPFSKSLTLTSSSYTSNYQLISYSENWEYFKHYLFETDCIISSVISQP